MGKLIEKFDLKMKGFIDRMAESFKSELLERGCYLPPLGLVQLGINSWDDTSPTFEPIKNPKNPTASWPKNPMRAIMRFVQVSFKFMTVHFGDDTTKISDTQKATNYLIENWHTLKDNKSKDMWIIFTYQVKATSVTDGMDTISANVSLFLVSYINNDASGSVKLLK